MLVVGDAGPWPGAAPGAWSLGARQGDTFAGRVRDACMVVGVSSSEELVARARRNGHTLTAERLSEILAYPERMLASEVLTLAELLRVRVRWLAQGQGPATPVTTSAQTEDVLLVIDALPKEKVAELLRIARRMTWEEN